MSSPKRMKWIGKNAPRRWYSKYNKRNGNFSQLRFWFSSVRFFPCFFVGFFSHNFSASAPLFCVERFFPFDSFLSFVWFDLINIFYSKTSFIMHRRCVPRTGARMVLKCVYSSCAAEFSQQRAFVCSFKCRNTRIFFFFVFFIFFLLFS